MSLSLTTPVDGSNDEYPTFHANPRVYAGVRRCTMTHPGSSRVNGPGVRRLSQEGTTGTTVPAWRLAWYGGSRQQTGARLALAALNRKKIGPMEHWAGSIRTYVP
jgi:hypothetical protein